MSTDPPHDDLSHSGLGCIAPDAPAEQNIPGQTQSFSDDGNPPGSPTGTALFSLDRVTTNDTARYGSSVFSPSRAREESHRREDNLELLRAERVASRASQMAHGDIYRSKSKRDPPTLPNIVDEMDDSTNPVHNSRKIPWKPPVEPATKVAKFFKKIHESSLLVRYFSYIVPIALILLIPLLLGALKFRGASVGGVSLMWFMVWLEVVWLSLWAGRIVSKLIPYPVGVIASALTNGSKKWRDMANMLEVPATLFFWGLAVYISFLPVMRGNHLDGTRETRYWEKNANLVLLCFLIGFTLNLVEKILVQLIAISFHTRTYADRIELNKFQIASLSKLYKYARDIEKLGDGAEPLTGTPKPVLLQAKQGAQRAANRVGDVVGRIAGDFTGREVTSSTSPQQVVLTLLQSTEGSNVLARRLYRSFVQPEEENVHADDLRVAFASDEQADAAFSMFDRDLNGDISCEEMELACVEIGRERKAIAASMKDLDSVVGKLDDCLTFVVAVVVIMVFLSLISKSTAGVLTSASSSILALSWLFSATAQEFLASLIFVFIKHPFDVGDRVDIYNTGISTTDTFYVREIALMYTEFKKVEGHIVQAPNSLLNTLFILNMRRSAGITEAIPIVCKFGTTLQQIDELRERMLDFVKSEKREYQPKILTELKDIPDMHSVKLNVVFFYKSNWQNDLVRLQRRNKFMCTLMCNISELGIESPNMRWPGQKLSAPMYLQSVQGDQLAQPTADDNPPPGPNGNHTEILASPPGLRRQGSTHSGLERSLSRGPSIRGKKVDFSLGVKDLTSMDDSGDVFDDRPRRGLVPTNSLRRVIEEEEENEGRTTARANGESRNLGEGLLHRRRTGSNAGGSMVSHRNRFFGSRGTQDEEMAITTPYPSVISSRVPHAHVCEEVEMDRL